MRWHTLAANGVAAYKTLRQQPIGGVRGAAYIQVMPKNANGFNTKTATMLTTADATKVTQRPLGGLRRQALSALDTFAQDEEGHELDNPCARPRSRKFSSVKVDVYRPTRKKRTHST